MSSVSSMSSDPATDPTTCSFGAAAWTVKFLVQLVKKTVGEEQQFLPPIYTDGNMLSKAQNKVLARFKEAQKNAAHHSPGKCPSLDQPLPSKRKRVAPSLFEAVPAHQGGEKVARHKYLVEGTIKLKQGVTTHR